MPVILSAREAAAEAEHRAQQRGPAPGILYPGIPMPTCAAHLCTWVFSTEAGAWRLKVRHPRCREHGDGVHPGLLAAQAASS